MSKKVWPVSSRDFVLNYILNQEEDGTIIEFATSENVDFNFPEVPGNVRGFAARVGTIISPDPSDPSKSNYFYFSEIDLSGIPDWI